MDAHSLHKVKERIIELKKECNIAILAHNYQLPDIQDLADYRGDSLGLSRIAATLTHKIICFCGVRFMAESADILCEDKRVIIPDLAAGCPLADDFTIEELRELRKNNPRAAVVCYVNSSAEVKAESDICCTSANAVDIVNSLTQYDEIIFIPDRNLGSYVSLHTDKKVILSSITCPVHNNLTKEELLNEMAMHPEAEFIAHPECSPDVLAYAHFISSTSGMAGYIKKSKAQSFIIGTERGMIYSLQKEFPERSFYFPGKLLCNDMKVITIEKLEKCLKTLQPVIKISDHLKMAARRALSAMMEVHD
ncbi:MAG: quinolinate synthase NadA [bacterium]